jgi:hypothetical protein
MLTIVVLIVSVTISAVLLLVIVAVGIRREPPTEELSERASSLIAAFVRRLLGLHVRKPDSPPSLGRGGEGRILARVTRSPDPLRKPNLNER